MANIIKHETTIRDLYMYIDDVVQDNQKYTFKGWIISAQGLVVEKLLIDNKELDVKFSTRSDVNQAYNINSENAGISFTLSSEDLFKPLYIKFKEGHESYPIESMSKWVAYHSGYSNEDKGLIVVDNFYKDPDFIREWAIREIEFSPSDYHKGERAINRFSTYGMKEKLEEIIGKPIFNWNYERYANGIFQFCTADQPIVYHVDNQTYAGIVFLTPEAPASTGTSFYRSKFTGDYKFDDEKRQTENYVRAFKGRSAEMNFYDGTNFEKIDEVGNVYNRLVLFDAKNIHAATQYFGDKIDNSRLFHMFFFDV